MSDLRNKVIKLAYDNPELRSEILPLLKTARDPADVAYEMVTNYKKLTKTLEKHVDKIDREMDSAKKQVDKLSEFGSGAMSAPSVIAGQPLKELKDLRYFLDNLIGRIEELSKYGR